MAPDAVKRDPAPDEQKRSRLPGGFKLSSTLQIALIVALILIALVGLCQVTGLAAKLGLGPAPVPTATPTALPPTPTLVPTITSTPTPAATPTATPPPQLAVGGKAVVQGTSGQKLHVRASPGTTQQVIIDLDDGAKLQILEGPQAADGYTWWKVQTEDSHVGWAADNWLTPVAP